MGKKRKMYYNQEKSNAKKLKFNNKVKLGANMKGFLITYNCKFTFCINEAKKLLEQFSIPDTCIEENTTDNKSTDVEKLLKDELDSLNKRDKEFNVLDTNAKHTIFISLNSINPNQVVEAIFDHIETTKKPLGRFVQRLVPVLNTCKAYLEDIEKCFKETLDQVEAIKKCEQTAFKYCCVFKTSNNNQISRDSIFKLAGSYIQSKNRQNTVDFDNPDYVLLVHVICNMCYISFLSNYFNYRKYNLIEMSCKFGKVEGVVSGQTKKNANDAEQKLATHEAVAQLKYDETESKKDEDDDNEESSENEECPKEIKS